METLRVKIFSFQTASQVMIAEVYASVGGGCVSSVILNVVISRRAILRIAWRSNPTDGLGDCFTLEKTPRVRNDI